MIQNIKLTNFRKFNQIELPTDNKIVILTGPNATGKTSILEAIYLIATAKSHRTNDLMVLIKDNENYGIVEIKEEKEFKSVISKEGKTNYINGVNYLKLSDFVGNLNVIMVSPLDIELINGSNGARRRFLDLEISLLDKVYLRSIMVYKKLLKERNELLKVYNSENSLILNVLTSQFIEKIKELYNKRINFIHTLNSKLKLVTEKLQCEKVKIQYVASYDINNLEKNFESKLNYDVTTKTTNIGLHRDSFKIYINDQEVENYASEGQARMVILAIKLALKEIYSSNGLKVILLLDDIFASIDQKRINHIMEYIKNEEQAFITTTSIFNIPDELIRQAKIIKL